MINIAEPNISADNISAVVSALRKNSVSTYGDEVARFEASLSRHFKLDTCCVNSGTSALEISIDCHFNNLKRNKKYVIGFCDYTFIATPNAILNTNNLPFCIRCDPSDFTIDLDHLKKVISQSRSIDLLIITLPFGNSNENIEKAIALCNAEEIPVIIDAAASIGIDYNEVITSFSNCESVCLSFNGNKVITSGAGGAILSSNMELMERVRNLISLNRLSNYEHFAPGQNKKMPALNAALGLSQFHELEEKIRRRRYIFNRYKSFQNEFASIGLELFPVEQYTVNAHWIYFLKPMENHSYMNNIREYLKQNGFNSPPFWKPVSQQLEYRKFLVFGDDEYEVNYPDLMQLPVTLDNPDEEVEKLVKLVKVNR